MQTPRILAPILLLLLAFVLASATRRLQSEATSPFPVAASLRLGLEPVGGISPDDLSRVRVPMEHTLRWGETLEGVFESFGLERSSAREAIDATSEHLDPRTLRAGDAYATLVSADGDIAGFAFARAGDGRVVVQRSGGGWRSTFHPFRKAVRVVHVVGELTGPLELALKEAGGHGPLAYRLEDVLQWDLDFNRDLRVGDRFEVLYEVERTAGEPDRVRDVLALRYQNRGRRHEAYRYGDGYYDGDGRPLRKQFLRSPLQYSSRVTSRFSHRRLHPILKVRRPHLGVDYGAPVGTPVRVTAAGAVDFIGSDGGGGKTVRVRHPNGYLTAYLHLSRYAQGLRRGTRVEQGEVVGFVGSTGLSTAPHLDYRVRQNGRWIDPLSLEIEPAPPIPEAELERYYAVRDELRTRLGATAEPARGAVAAGHAAPRSDPAQSAGR